jgi:hypothetical protein
MNLRNMNIVEAAATVNLRKNFTTPDPKDTYKLAAVVERCAARAKLLRAVVCAEAFPRVSTSENRSLMRRHN